MAYNVPKLLSLPSTDRTRRWRKELRKPLTREELLTLGSLLGKRIESSVLLKPLQPVRALFVPSLNFEKGTPDTHAMRIRYVYLIRSSIIPADVPALHSGFVLTLADGATDGRDTYTVLQIDEGVVVPSIIFGRPFKVIFPPKKFALRQPRGKAPDQSPDDRLRMSSNRAPKLEKAAPRSPGKMLRRRHIDLFDSPPQATERDHVADALMRTAVPDLAPHQEELPPREVPRYTDVTLFSGYFAAYDKPTHASRLDPAAPMRSNADYTIEIAIRAKLTGLPSATPDAAIVPPRQDNEPVKLRVFLGCNAPEAVHIANNFRLIEWRFDQDSDRAVFNIETGDTIPDDVAFEVRVYSHALTLLDIFTVERIDGTWTKNREGHETPCAQVDDDGPTAMAFHLRPASGGVKLDCTITRDEDNEPFHIMLDHIITRTEAADVLAAARRHWSELVTGTMSARDSVTNGTMKTVTTALAEIGRRAWRTLLSDSHGDIATNAASLRDHLEDTPLPEGAPIKITQDPGVADFAFPWSIIHPTAPDPAASSFWGLKHPITISQIRKLRTRRAKPGQIGMSAVIDSKFNFSARHAEYLDELDKRYANLSITKATTKTEILTSVSQKDSSDIYYFYCHGKSAKGGPSIPPELFDALDAPAKDLDTDQLAYFETLQDILRKGPTRASIFNSKAWVDIDDFANAGRYFLDRPPLVFLNCCYSADLSPGLAGGLAGFFLERSAFAVIGTECPVTDRFAHAFAQHLFARLIAGDSLANAMLDARRHFHAARNPLSLLYTVYGWGDYYLTNAQEGVSR